RLGRILSSARQSKKVHRGLTGTDRHALYALACGTGFRAGGLSRLTPECFDLDTQPPTVTLPIRGDKSRRGKVQPLPADVVELMRAYLAGKPSGKPLGRGTWIVAAAEMLRADLEAAGVPYVTRGPDGPEPADFHALRHSADCRIMPTGFAT